MLITSYTRPIRLLHLESSEQDHELVKFALRRSGGTFDVVRAQTLREFCDQIDTVNYDVILSDYRFADFTAIDAKRASIYTQRTTTNAQVSVLKARLDATPAVEAPDEEVSLAALVAEQILDGVKVWRGMRFHRHTIGRAQRVEIKRRHDRRQRRGRRLMAAHLHAIGILAHMIGVMDGPAGMPEKLLLQRPQQCRARRQTGIPRISPD